MVARGGQQRIPRPGGARPGGRAPWSDLDPAARRFTLDEVRARCAALPPPVRPDEVAPGSRAAAVLLPVFEEAREARIILTKRPETMPSHQGEIAFPGGTHQPDVDESLRDAALREAKEEIGLDPETVDVVGELDSLPTFASRFTIAPFVGLLEGRPVIRADPFEVVAVFDVALSELLDPEVYREERWDMTPEGVAPQLDRSVHFYLLPGETVWGATARILTGFLSHLTAPRLANG
ncbi:MAG: CoA pyrophosphatase [Actinobacteria bacterium]|nr:CoA pyrophosphatase [Actinomycetota bacterium]